MDWDWTQDCDKLEGAYTSLARQLEQSEEKRQLAQMELQQIQSAYAYSVGEVDSYRQVLKTTQADHMKDLQRLKEMEKFREQNAALETAKAFVDNQLGALAAQNEQLSAQGARDQQTIDRLCQENRSLQESVKELTAQKKELLAKKIHNEELILSLNAKLSQQTNQVDVSLYQQKLASLESELDTLRRAQNSRGAQTPATSASSKLSLATQRASSGAWNSPSAPAPASPISRLHRAKRQRGSNPGSSAAGLFQFDE